jgi:hypothetical protein
MPDHDERISQLYRASRDRLAPPAELDARILAEAHRQRPRRRRLPLGALGAAATLVIGVGLAWFHIGVPPQMLPPPALEEALDQSGPAAPAALLRSDKDTLTAAPPSPTPASALQQAVPNTGSTLQRQAEPERRARAAAAPALEAAAGRPGISHAAAKICGLDLEGASQAEWREAIAAAQARGDNELTGCLTAAFRERFDGDATRQ